MPAKVEMMNKSRASTQKQNQNRHKCGKYKPKQIIENNMKGVTKKMNTHIEKSFLKSINFKENQQKTRKALTKINLIWW